jgi:hypothetical protein
MCILEKERGHIGSIWSRVTCSALPLGAAQSLECRAPGDSLSLKHRAPGDSLSLRCLTVAIGNKQHKQINKQYTKQCLMAKQAVSRDATRHYERVSIRII